MSGTNEDHRIISKKELRSLVLYSPTHIDRLERIGLFPKRIRLGAYRGSRVAWRLSEVLAWLKEKISSRTGAD
jgi:prophage regulatory protein